MKNSRGNFTDLFSVKCIKSNIGSWFKNKVMTNKVYWSGVFLSWIIALISFPPILEYSKNNIGPDKPIIIAYPLSLLQIYGVGLLTLTIFLLLCSFVEKIRYIIPKKHK